MPRGIQRARLDRNQKEIVEALRAAGMSVVSLAAVGNGCPDIAVGYNGWTFMLEIKDGKLPPSARRLTDAESRFASLWRGHLEVVNSTEEALAVIYLRLPRVP